jgi:macrolide transport system ATP-binding/permease protein
LDYAGRDVLDIDELEIHSYDRIGLVGDNGAERWIRKFEQLL